MILLFKTCSLRIKNYKSISLFLCKRISKQTSQILQEYYIEIEKCEVRWVITPRWIKKYETKNNLTQIKKTMISLKEKLNENDIWHGLKVEKSSETLYFVLLEFWSDYEKQCMEKKIYLEEQIIQEEIVTNFR